MPEWSKGEDLRSSGDNLRAGSNPVLCIFAVEIANYFVANKEKTCSVGVSTCGFDPHIPGSIPGKSTFLCIMNYYDSLPEWLTGQT